MLQDQADSKAVMEYLATNVIAKFRDGGEVREYL